MFKKASDKEIGAYLSKLIDKKFPSTRQFCKAYIEAENGVVNNETLRNKANRLSQIRQGKKPIQVYDLEYFTELLGVSCEELLSAGNRIVINDDRMTNYKFAFSKDKELWEEYIHREDGIIMNIDEYGKTVIDYALECKNYDLLKYLMENEYIWFVGPNEKDYVLTFGAGTNIKRPMFAPKDLSSVLLEEDRLRREMISLAIENHDYDVLTQLKAREIPTMYMACYIWNNPPEISKYYDKYFIKQIACADNKTLDYFAESFEIENSTKRKNRFIFPYMNELLNELIKNKNRHVNAVLEKCIEHNKSVYHKLKELFEISKNSYNDTYIELFGDRIPQEILRYFEFDESNRVIGYSTRDYSDGIISNIVSTNIESTDELTNDLIHELNCWYDRIINAKP